MLCARDSPIPVTTHFAAQIVVFDVKIPITVGFPVSVVSDVSFEIQELGKITFVFELTGLSSNIIA